MPARSIETALTLIEMMVDDGDSSASCPKAFTRVSEWSGVQLEDPNEF